MKPVLERLDRGLHRVYEAAGYLAALFLVLLAVFILASIVSRLAGVYVPGLSEYASYSMAASSFLALAHTFRAGGHIRVNVLLSRLHGASRRAAEIWCLAVAAILTLYLAFYSVSMTLTSYRFQERSEGADAIFLWIPQLGMAIGATVLAVALTHSLVRVALGADGREMAADNVGGHP